ncbi:MAG: hypothetical protein KKF56_02975 [Nanoarchaeota archaeon]|nr:hypothetical protein [Nanoarchaeota archaeon]
MLIKGKDAEEVWKKALNEIMEKGEEHIDNRNRQIKEIMNMQLEIQAPNEIEKPIEILNSFEKWKYPPFEEIKNFILSKKNISGYYYNYGARAFNFNGKNQVDDYIIPMLKKNDTSKRAVIIFYNPTEDSHFTRKDTPGLIQMDFKIRKGKLNVTSIIRSNNMFFGWPANIFQTYCLLDYIAKEIGTEIGTITTFSTSAHVINEQYDAINKVLNLK